MVTAAEVVRPLWTAASCVSSKERCGAACRGQASERRPLCRPDAGVTSVGVHNLSPGMVLTDLLLKARPAARHVPCRHAPALLGSPRLLLGSGAWLLNDASVRSSLQRSAVPALAPCGCLRFSSAADTKSCEWCQPLIGGSRNLQSHMEFETQQPAVTWHDVTR